jgi:hypothetical protein
MATVKFFDWVSGVGESFKTPIKKPAEASFFGAMKR